jgi:hypothetical protein
MSSKHPDSTILATNEYKPGALSRAVARCSRGKHSWIRDDHLHRNVILARDCLDFTCRYCGAHKTVSRP